MSFLFGGTTVVEAPKPTAAEQALQREQAESLRLQRALLEQQQQFQSLLQPILFEQFGIIPTTEDVGPLRTQLSQLTEQAERLRSQRNALPFGSPEQAQIDAQLEPLDAQRLDLQNRIQSGGSIIGFERDQQFLETQDAQRQLELDALNASITSFDLQNTLLQQQLDDLLAEDDTLESVRRQIAELERTPGRGATVTPEGEVILGEERFESDELARLRERESELVNEQLAQNIERQLLERTQAALEGELPVNPALLRDLEEGRADLEARLREQLGTGFETSSPGIEALSNFEQREAEILEGARRGDLTLAEQLSLARTASNRQGDILGVQIPSQVASQGIGFGQAGSSLASATRGGNLAGLSGIAGMQGNTIAGFGNLASGFGAAQQPFQFNRQMAFDAAIQNANRPNPFGQLFGTIAGGAIGAFTGGLGTAAGASLGGSLFGGAT